MKSPLSAPPSAALVNETLTGLELPRLLLRAPQLALAARGNGQRVLVWPGFGAGDLSTLPLRSYLGYLGYRAEGWGLGRNDADVLMLIEVLRRKVIEASRTSPVALVGWSLGGYLAREVARECPDRVSRVITLGSPVVGGPKYTAVGSAFAGREAMDQIEAQVDARYQVPLTVPVTAIYSKLDGVVAWRACIDDRSPSVEHVEVISTHTGLGFSAPALEVIASRLATAA